MLPKDINKDSLLWIHYTSDVTRTYAESNLIIDNLYNGRLFDVALWHLNNKQINRLELRIMPLRSDTKVNQADDM